MNLYPKNSIPIPEVKKFIVIFYIVGLLGFFIPFTKNIFILITPFAQLLGIYLLALYHPIYSRRNISLFLLVFLMGYIIEVIGIKTGVIFGTYHYGKTLGLKILETPLLIGVNWLFLTYTSTSIFKRYINKPVFTILFAPLLMVVYDIVLEQVAPKIGMWYWEGSSVPLKNYFAWYIIGMVFVSLFQVFKIETKNTMASILFVCQFLFFVMLIFVLQ